MSNEKKANNKKTTQSQAAAVETLYTRDEIKAQPSAFGVAPEVLAGALTLVKDKELSRSQVVKAIEEFKKRKV